MDDRWAYPTPMKMQRQAGSAPKPRKVTSPPVAPDNDEAQNRVKTQPGTPLIPAKA